MAPYDERFELALSDFSDTFALLRSDIDLLRGIVPDSCLVELHNRTRLAYSQFLFMQSELDYYVDHLQSRTVIDG